MYLSIFQIKLVSLKDPRADVNILSLMQCKAQGTQLRSVLTYVTKRVPLQHSNVLYKKVSLNSLRLMKSKESTAHRIGVYMKYSRIRAPARRSYSLSQMNLKIASK